MRRAPRPSGPLPAIVTVLARVIVLLGTWPTASAPPSATVTSGLIDDPSDWEWPISRTPLETANGPVKAGLAVLRMTRPGPLSVRGALPVTGPLKACVTVAAGVSVSGASRRVEPVRETGPESAIASVPETVSAVGTPLSARAAEMLRGPESAREPDAGRVPAAAASRSFERPKQPLWTLPEVATALTAILRVPLAGAM